MENNQVWIECVPNVSEGRNQDVIQEIAESFAHVEGAQLLHVDSSASANRTVYTIAGQNDSVFIAMRAFMKKATELINMETHAGVHPRIGAVDVIPFVGLSGIKEADLKWKVHQLARETAYRLHMPVYMYEKTALKKHRQNLAAIRKGEYEGLEEKMKSDEWKPDYGENLFNKKSGASVIGLRDLLIAFNVGLDTKDPLIAQRIALEVRSAHPFQYDELGEKFPKEKIIPHIKSISWFMKEYDQYQVSMNLTNFRETGLYEAIELCRRSAEKYGVRLLGSEIIGMLPKKALESAIEKYDHIHDLKGLIQFWGLDWLKDFNPEERILDRQLGFSIH